MSPLTGAPAATEEAAFSPPRTSAAALATRPPLPPATVPATTAQSLTGSASGHISAAAEIARTAQSPASARTGGPLANVEVSA